MRLELDARGSQGVVAHDCSEGHEPSQNGQRGQQVQGDPEHQVQHQDGYNAPVKPRSRQQPAPRRQPLSTDKLLSSERTQA